MNVQRGTAGQGQGKSQSPQDGVRKSHAMLAGLDLRDMGTMISNHKSIPEGRAR